MENYKSELTILKEELNSRIDAVIAKIEKPHFEAGKWYKINSDSKIVCCYKGACDGYGIDSGYNWSDSLLMSEINLWSLATEKEVEEALTKEAVKRGFKEGVTIDKTNIPMYKNNSYKIWKATNNKFTYYKNFNILEIGNDCIFQQGTWATPIKTKTIEELAIEFDNFAKNSSNIHLYFKEYLTENKQEIIETLNNL